MLEYLVKRLATIVPTLVLVSMLIFGLQQLLPGDPAKILAGEEQDPTVIAYLHKKLHLDEPLPVRYAWWVGGVLRGDLGESVRTQQPVVDLVLQKLPVTVELALLAFAIAYVPFRRRLGGVYFSIVTLALASMHALAHHRLLPQTGGLPKGCLSPSTSSILIFGRKSTVYSLPR